MEQQLTTKTVATPARCPPPRAGAANQQGMVLFIALIVLVAMTLAGIALLRSVDTANVIAGNLAFKQAALQAGDLGVEAAVTALPGIAVDDDQPLGCTSCLYYASRRKTDGNGVPMQEYFGAAGVATAIDWSLVPIASTAAGNSVRIVIDRLCQGPVPPSPAGNLLGLCFADAPVAGGSGSQKAGSSIFSVAPTVYYRVTARVTGPRNTVSMVQAILSR